MRNGVKGFYAASLSAIFGLACIPLQASAQLPPLPLPGGGSGGDRTPPTVRITSPASGATVSGSISVTAEASDDVRVAGVQFQYNGNNFDAEDTTAPYTATANTSYVPDGSYTLTAVARDAAGNRTTSAPVQIRVANAPPPPPGVTRYEEREPSVRYSGAGWQEFGAHWLGWSGRSAVASSVPGARASFTFTGTSVAWIGYRGSEGGIARVSLDGVVVGEVDLFARSTQVHVPVFVARGLSDGTHTLTIEVTGLKHPEAQFNRVVVDAFHVPAPFVSQLQETDPAVTYTAGWGPATDSMSWSNGGAVVSETSGARLSARFNGTWIAWNGMLSPETGIARVYLDGVFMAEVDTYLPEYQLQGTVFASPPLADGSHTLVIEATGLRNSASTGSRIVVDSFDVAAPLTRFEETDGAASYVGAWQAWSDPRLSGGTMMEWFEAGSRATFTFTGRAVTWIGVRASFGGIANVYVDGVLRGQVDTYCNCGSGSPRAQTDVPMFTASFAQAGSHTLTIEVTGTRNPLSTDSWVMVDAFDVRP